MNEYDIVRTMAAKYPRSKEQINRLFECDAELIRIGDAVWGLTMDDFSPEEDLFTSDNPSMLGANLAVATLSDLFAAGVSPKFFMHAVSLPRKVDSSFIDAFNEGINGVLNEAECALCGGDLGISDNWRYCGFAMGPVVSSRPITHRMPDFGQTLWITGDLGDANLSAIQRIPTPSFQLRLKEAKLIQRYATACIDTSGGLMDALWILHTMNPGIRFDLHAESIPMAGGIREFSKMAGIPAEAALLGGAGEYELLFATQKELPDAFLDSFNAAGITAIGEIGAGGSPGIHISRHGKSISTMTTPPPCPRAAGSMEDNIKAVARAATILFPCP